MTCDKCGGSMSPNQKKKPGSKMPDWVCDQANGPCVNEAGYVTGKWNPTLGAPKVVSTTTKVVGDKPNWDKIAEGKVRHGVVCAMIEAGKSKEEIFADAEGYVQFIIKSSEPF